MVAVNQAPSLKRRSMPISVVCECGRKLKAPDQASGKKARCPACGGQVTVPPPIIELVEEKRPFWKDPIVVVGASMPAAVLIGFLGYLAFTRSGNATQSSTAQATSIGVPSELSTIRPRKIPIEVSYPIVEDQSERTKRNVRVRLNMKVTEDVLREIALEVKGQARRQYERTFIFYEVPSRIPGYDSSRGRAPTSTRTEG